MIQSCNKTGNPTAATYTNCDHDGMIVNLWHCPYQGFILLGLVPVISNEYISINTDRCVIMYRCNHSYRFCWMASDCHIVIWLSRDCNFASSDFGIWLCYKTMGFWQSSSVSSCMYCQRIDYNYYISNDCQWITQNVKILEMVYDSLFFLLTNPFLSITMKLLMRMRCSIYLVTCFQLYVVHLYTFFCINKMYYMYIQVYLWENLTS